MSKGDARSLGRYHDDEELFSTDDVALPDPLEQEVRLVEGFDGSQTNTVAFFPDMSGHFLAKAYTATGGSKQVGSIFLRNPQQTEECVFELWQCSATLVVTKAERSPLSNSSSSKNNSKGSSSSSSSSSKGKLLSRQQELDFSFLPSISAILELYVLCSIVLHSFFVCDVSVFLSRSISACLHSMTPHDTSLTIIPLFNQSPKHNPHITYNNTTGMPAAEALSR
jgi:hypothetical protein